jgi:hypothetical protein
VTVLNVECGFMSDYPGIFVDWDDRRRNLQEVFDEADDMLAATLDSNAGNDPTAAQMQALKDFFDLINNNSTTLTHVYIVLPGVVPFTTGPLPCVPVQPEEPPPQD